MSREDNCYNGIQFHCFHEDRFSEYTYEMIKWPNADCTEVSDCVFIIRLKDSVSSLFFFLTICLGQNQGLWYFSSCKNQVYESWGLSASYAPWCYVWTSYDQLRTTLVIYRTDLSPPSTKSKLLCVVISDQNVQLQLDFWREYLTTHITSCKLSNQENVLPLDL